jgi:hypothetical protein
MESLEKYEKNTENGGLENTLVLGKRYLRKFLRENNLWRRNLNKKF